jgi:hypothetical protein
MTNVHQNPPPKLPSGLLLGLGIAFAVNVLLSIGQHLLDQWRYNNAMQAYRKAECNAAIDQLNPVIDAFRLFDVDNYVSQAQQKKAECERFQTAVDQQQKGKAETALMNYLILAKVYENSALLDPARQQILKLFQMSQTKPLATPKVCEQLENLMAKNLIPKLDTKVSQFYLSCGNSYETNQTYARAIGLYKRLLEQDLDHTQTQKLEAALARATVADIKQQGAKEIGPPTRIANTEDGSTVVEIQNTSPRKMRIIFSGSTPKFEELEPCQDCKIYMYEGPGPCPRQGPKKRYTLAPGQYKIAVNFTEIPGEIIESWVADWKLDEGAEYGACFVIVNGLREESQDPEKPENRRQPLRIK